jgi:mycothiol synthase
VIVRPADGDEDLTTSLAIFNDVFPREAVDADEANAFFASVLSHVRLLAELDGSPAGFGLGAFERTDPGVALTVVTVRPDARGRGIGSALLDRLRGWGREGGADQLETWLADGDEPSLAYARRRRFETVAREIGFELDLPTATVGEPAPPDGVEIVCLADRPALADGMYDVASEAIPDIPGSEVYVMYPRAEFVERHLRRPHGLAEGTFVALADGEVAGYAKLRLSGARPGVAINGLTAVKRAWRGRGIAGALKRTQVAWATAAGYERLVAANEVRNEPIRRLNERLGYRPAPGRIILRAPISDVT